MKFRRHVLAAASALLALGTTQAQAQTQMPGTVESHCITAEACLAQMTQQLAAPVRGATSALARSQDNFYWFGRINMASAVMLTEQRIIPAELAAPIARGLPSCCAAEGAS